MVHVALQGVSPAQRAAEHSGCRDAGHSQAAALGVASKHNGCMGAAGAARLGHERRLTAQLSSWSTAPSAKGHGSSTLMLWSDECKEEQELLKLRVISAQEQTDFSLASPPRCGAGLLAAARRGPEHPLAGPGTPGCSLEVPAPRPLWAGGGAGSGRSHQPRSAPRTRSWTGTLTAQSPRRLDSPLRRNELGSAAPSSAWVRSGTKGGVGAAAALAGGAMRRLPGSSTCAHVSKVPARPACPAQLKRHLFTWESYVFCPGPHCIQNSYLASISPLLKPFPFCNLIKLTKRSLF